MAAVLRRAGFRKGVLGGNRAFLVVWLVLTGIKLMKHLTGDEKQVVYSEELRPGEKLLITHEPRP